MTEKESGMTPQQRRELVESVRREHARQILTGPSIRSTTAHLIPAINCIRDCLQEPRKEIAHGNFEEALMFVAEEMYQEMLVRRKRAKGE